MIDIDTFLKKLPKNVGELGKLIAAKGFEKLPKIRKIMQSGHTVPILTFLFYHSFYYPFNIACKRFFSYPFS